MVGVDYTGVAQTVTKLAIDTGKAAYQYHSAKKAEKALDRAADRTSKLNELNERAMQAENAEMERRTLAKNQETESLARAKAAASGAALSGSMADYLSFLETENLQQFEWLKTSGSSKLAAMEAAGASNVRAIKTQADAQGDAAIGAVIGGAASTFQTGLDAGGWGGEDAWYRGGAKFSEGNMFGASSAKSFNI